MADQRTPEMVEAYRTLVQAADNPILISDVETSLFVDANQLAIDKLGYSMRELARMSPKDINRVGSREFNEVGNQLTETGEIKVRNVPVRHRRGHLLFMEVSVKRYVIDGCAYHVNILREEQAHALSRDIIGGSRHRLLESEAVHRGLVEFADDAVFVCMHDTQLFAEVNPAAQKMFGYAMSDLGTLRLGDLHRNADTDGLARMHERLEASGAASWPDIVMTRKDGTTFHAHLKLNVYEAASRKLIVGIVRDVTEQLERERQLRDASARLATSEATYRGLVACTDDAVLIADFESGLIVEANPAACALFGYSGAEWNALVGHRLHPEETNEEVEHISRALREQGSSRRIDLPMRRKDGSVFSADLIQNVFEAAGRQLIVGIIRDVTERRRQAERLENSYRELQQAQARAIHSQKLAALGEIAAGVAHEINNPAAFVSMNLDSMVAEVQRVEVLLRNIRAYIAREAEGERKAALSQLLEDNAVDVRGLRSMLNDNREGIARVQSVTRDLRLFSRVEQREVVAVDLNEVVRSTLNLLMNELRHRARVEVALEDLPKLNVQRGKLAQVMTNLLLNASHAVVEGAVESNTISVRTTLVAGVVHVAVEDTGVGMSDEVVDQIFDPFFTTKPRDQGTGLGLSLCAEIVAAHQGDIQVTSEPGRGSCFTVKIPVDTGLALAATPPSEARRAAPRVKRILVIDDDAAMVRAYRRLLREHDAIVVPSGARALEVLGEDTSFDMILCDLMMPEMDGPQVYDEIEAAMPELIARMVFCTGGAFTPRAREFVARIDNPVLDKPLDMDELERILRAE